MDRGKGKGKDRDMDTDKGTHTVTITTAAAGIPIISLRPMRVFPVTGVKNVIMEH